MIPVTKTFLPPKEEYQEQIQRVWDNNWVTNGGELVRRLETKLKTYLNISNVVLTANGTLPLQITLKVLAGNGEVITTPFSYVATTAAIVWENCTPVFVDIHPEYLTIDETKIEAAITENTTTILATHVFGNPCNIEKIEKIALKYGLKVIYDAAHCFGVKYKGESIFNYGDVSTCSFHATKLFHTGEGGAMICKDSELHHQLFYSHNAGHKGHLDFYGLGINAKMSELHAGMGLAVFPYVERNILSRKQAVSYYRKFLDTSSLSLLKIRDGAEWNYSYFPVVFDNQEQLLKVEQVLNQKDIFPRRYFYPSLNTLDYVDSLEMKVSQDVAKKILCLPLYEDLDPENIELISRMINETIA